MKILGANGCGLGVLLMVFSGCAANHQANVTPPPSPTLSNFGSVSSPDGHVTATLSWNKDAGNIYLSVTRDSVTFLQPSRLGISFSSFALGSGFTDPASKTSASTGHDEPKSFKSGKRLSEDYAFGQIVATCLTNGVSGHFLTIKVQVSNDGVAFNYGVDADASGTTCPGASPSTQNMTSEFTAYNLPAGPSSDTNGYLQNRYDSNGHYQNDNELYYRDTSTAGFPNEVSYPALFNIGNGNWMILTEAATDVTFQDGSIGYPDGHIAKDSGLRDVYHQWFQGLSTWAPTVHLPFTSPWRVVILGSTKTLFESDLVRELGNAPESGINFSSFGPGFVSSSHYAQNDDFDRNAVDAAVDLNLDWVNFDYSWDAIPGDPNTGDPCIVGPVNGFTCPNDGRGSPIDYAHSKGKKVLLWAQVANFNPSTGLCEMANDPVALMSRYKGLGADAVEVDFIEGYHGSGPSSSSCPANQYQNLSRYYDWAKAAAVEGLAVVWNGNSIPRGLERRFPNILGWEGVRGTEHFYTSLASGDVTPTSAQDNVLTYSRGVLAGMDWLFDPYTEGRQHQDSPITTRGHTIAQTIVFDSGLSPFWGGQTDFMDGLEAGTAELAITKDLVQNLPHGTDTWWTESVYLGGAPGVSTTVARKAVSSAGANKWYLGLITAEANAATYSVALSSFLAASDSHTYTATLYYDTPASDTTCASNGGTLTTGGANEQISKCTVRGASSSTTLSSIQIAANGGLVIRLQ